MQSRSKGASVWMDEWWYGLLLKALVLSLSLLSSLDIYIYIYVCMYIFQTWLSLFFLSLSFFWAMLFWHATFSFWGNHNLTLYFISGIFYKRDHQDKEHLLCGMDGQWCQFPVQECSKWMGRVRAYDRESMKSISLRSPNLTKLNRTSSNICIRVLHGV